MILQSPSWVSLLGIYPEKMETVIEKLKKQKQKQSEWTKLSNQNTEILRLARKQSKCL